MPDINNKYVYIVQILHFSAHRQSWGAQESVCPNPDSVWRTDQRSAETISKISVWYQGTRMLWFYAINQKHNSNFYPFSSKVNFSVASIPNIIQTNMDDVQKFALFFWFLTNKMGCFLHFERKTRHFVLFNILYFILITFKEVVSRWSNLK